MRCVCACLCVGISNLHTIYIYCLVVFYMCTKIKLLFVHTHALHTPYPTKPPQNRNSHHQPNQINWIHISIRFFLFSFFFFSFVSLILIFTFYFDALDVVFRFQVRTNTEIHFPNSKFIFLSSTLALPRCMNSHETAEKRKRNEKNLINKTDSSLTVNRYGAKKKEKLKIIRSVFVDTINVHSHRLHTKLWNGKKMNVYRATTCTIYSSSSSHTKLKKNGMP